MFSLTFGHSFNINHIVGKYSEKVC